MADITHKPTPKRPIPARQNEYPLLAYADRLVGDLREYVPMALHDFDEKAIHQARVSTRKLKAAIDLLRPIVSDDARKRFNRSTRRLRRRLGPLRDLDVMINHLKDLRGRARYAPAIEWLSKNLLHQRELVRQEAAAHGQSNAKLSAWWPLREEALKAKEAVASLLGNSVHLQLDEFAKRATALAAHAGADQPHSSSPAEDPHELRIAGKALRYTLDMAREEGHALPAMISRMFKRMQDALGLWHDYVVLTERAMLASVETLLAHHDSDLQANVLGLCRVTLAKADQSLAKFITLWMKNGPALHEAIRTAFPLTRAEAPATPAMDSTMPDTPVPPPDVTNGS